jgi:hypothetical protein
LKDKTGCGLIGFYIMPRGRRNFDNVLTRLNVFSVDGFAKFKSEKFFAIDSYGYDQYFLIPGGNDGARPGTPVTGMFRYNSQSGTPVSLEYYDGAAWSGVGGAGIGDGQTWQDVTASRAVSVVYTNSTGRPIMVAVTPSSLNYQVSLFAINGAVVGYEAFVPSAGGGSCTISLIIPAGATYELQPQSSTTVGVWWELR